MDRRRPLWGAASELAVTDGRRRRIGLGSGVADDRDLMLRVSGRLPDTRTRRNARRRRAPRGDASIVALLKEEGAGNAGCPMHPQPGVR